MESPFDYLPMKLEVKHDCDLAREKAKELYAIIQNAGGQSREKALANTKLEEALMWFNKHLSRL